MNGRELTLVRAILLPLVCCALFACAVAPASAQTPKVGDPPEASNMRLVGYDDLQARSAYQPTIHRQGERFIAYIGHHGGTDKLPKPLNPLTGQPEFSGTSILDVTDAAHPKYLRHIPGQEGTYEQGGAQMVRVCDGKALPKGDPNSVYLLRTFGGQAHEIWNVSIRPSLSSSRGSTASTTPIKAGGNARPASPIWSPALPGGAPGA